MEQDTDEQLICLNCGNDTFWVFRDKNTSELSLFCVACHDKVE